MKWVAPVGLVGMLVVGCLSLLWSGVGRVPAPKEIGSQVGCPAHGWSSGSRNDQGGDLVVERPESVTLCVYGETGEVEEGRPEAGTLHGTLIDQLTAELNALPRMPYSQFHACAGVGAPYPNLVLSTPGRPSRLIGIDLGGCDGVSNGTTVRRGSDKALDIFLRLYREQRVAEATAADRKPPHCARSLPPGIDGVRAAVVDELIGLAHWSAELPSTIASVSICRYLKIGDGLSLVRSARPSSASMPGFQSVLKNGLQLPSTDKAAEQCFHAGKVKALDLVRVRDDTAAIIDIAIVRSPCSLLMGTRVFQPIPQPAFLALIDQQFR